MITPLRDTQSRATIALRAIVARNNNNKLAQSNFETGGTDITDGRSIRNHCMQSVNQICRVEPLCTPT